MKSTERAVRLARLVEALGLPVHALHEASQDPRRRARAGRATEAWLRSLNHSPGEASGRERPGMSWPGRTTLD